MQRGISKVIFSLVVIWLAKIHFMNNLCHLQIESQKPYIAHKTCHKKRGKNIKCICIFHEKTMHKCIENQLQNDRIKVLFAKMNSGFMM